MLQQRYETCRKERESERTRLEESEKLQGAVMETLRELVSVAMWCDEQEESHAEEMEKAVAVAREAANAQGSEAAEATVRDTMTQMNYYYRQKEKNVEVMRRCPVDGVAGVSADGGVSDEPRATAVDAAESCQRGGVRGTGREASSADSRRTNPNVTRGAGRVESPAARGEHAVSP